MKFKTKRILTAGVAGCLLTACDDGPWYEGVFVGSTTLPYGNITVGTLRVENSSRNKLATYAHQEGVCASRVNFEVLGDSVRVAPISPSINSCSLPPFVMKRVTDTQASAIVPTVGLFALKKQ